MKASKYLILTVIPVLLIAVGGFLFYKSRNRDIVEVPTPTAISVTKNTPTFSIENAPSQSLKGEITTMSGEVDWQGRTATVSSQINSPQAVQQGENLTTGASGSLTLTFPNSCTINYSKNTEIDIIQTLPANVVFSQVSGTGEFIVNGSYPISIRVSSLLTELNGDATVSRNPIKPIVTVSIKSGSATLAFNDLNYISHEVKVSAGQTYTFNYGTRKGVLK